MGEPVEGGPALALISTYAHAFQDAREQHLYSVSHQGPTRWTASMPSPSSSVFFPRDLLLLEQIPADAVNDAFHNYLQEAIVLRTKVVHHDVTPLGHPEPLPGRRVNPRFCKHIPRPVLQHPDHPVGDFRDFDEVKIGTYFVLKVY